MNKSDAQESKSIIKSNTKNNKLVIKKHNFELAKNRLKKFSEEDKHEFAITKVDEKGFLFDHKVTGEELNLRLEAINKNFIAVNDTNNKAIKEFREVYNALDALDKEYITAILYNVKAIQKTSNDVKRQQENLKKQNDKLENHQSKLATQQSEIEHTVKNIQSITEILKAFKEKLESYKRLTDVDKIGQKVDGYQNRMEQIEAEANNHADKLHELEQADSKIRGDVTANAHDISLLNEYKNKLSGISHLHDIDSMYKDVKEHTATLKEYPQRERTLVDTINKNVAGVRKQTEEHQNRIEQIEAEANNHADKLHELERADNKMHEVVTSHADDISSLNEYRNKLDKIVHLRDVDSMHNDIKENTSILNDHAAKLDELGRTDSQMLEQITSNTYDISFLNEYRNELNEITHLHDIDSMYQDIGDHTSTLNECKKREGELAGIIQKNKEEVNENIKVMAEASNTAIADLTKKVNYAYWIAGGSAGLAIIELILLLR